MYAEDWTLVSLLVHVPVAVAWIALVGLEVFLCSVRDLSVGQRMRLIRGMRWPTVALLLVILVTGVWQTSDNPYVQVTSWDTLEELRTTTAYGTALFWKHVWVVGTVALAVATRFVIAPRALATGDDATRRVRLLAAGNLLFCVMTLLATVRMVITLH